MQFDLMFMGSIGLYFEEFLKNIFWISLNVKKVVRFFWPIYGLIFSDMIFKIIFFQKIPIKISSIKNNVKNNIFLIFFQNKIR